MSRLVLEVEMFGKKAWAFHEGPPPRRWTYAHAPHAKSLFPTRRPGW